jgi:quinol monooxygenase YgiN
MIRHIVLLRYRPDVPEAVRETLMRDLAAVVAAIPGCDGFHAHRNVSVEPPMIKGFFDGFTLDFADEAARAAYLADPAHAAVGARIVAATEGGAEGVIVFDHRLP